MSTDRELLESAAKAAGHSKSWIYEELDKQAEGHKAAWNPLTDDGDALRLAVKLNIDTLGNTPMDGQPAVSVTFPLDGDWSGHTELVRGGDEYAAIRRAIVRAAAAIGKAMP